MSWYPFPAWWSWLSPPELVDVVIGPPVHHVLRSLRRKHIGRRRPRCSRRPSCLTQVRGMPPARIPPELVNVRVSAVVHHVLRPLSVEHVSRWPARGGGCRGDLAQVGRMPSTRVPP